MNGVNLVEKFYYPAMCAMVINVIQIMWAHLAGRFGVWTENGRPSRHRQAGGWG